MNTPRTRTGLPAQGEPPKRTTGAYGPRMRFKVLGPLQVTHDEVVIALGGPKQRRSSRICSSARTTSSRRHAHRSGLGQRAAGGRPRERSTATSRTSGRRSGQIASRAGLRGTSCTSRRTSSTPNLRTAAGEARFANGSPGRAGSLLREALACGPGRPTPISRPSRRSPARSARLDELRLQALEERIAAISPRAATVEAIGELESLTRELPLRERLWELLMLALYRSRRPADALAAFERARDVLADELGVDPSPDLRRLHERILREDPDLTWRANRSAATGCSIRWARERSASSIARSSHRSAARSRSRPSIRSSRTIRTSFAGSSTRRRSSRGSSTRTSCRCTTTGASPMPRTW